MNFIDGSSPHTRGTPDDKTSDLCKQRFIPAYAGNANKCPGQRPEHAVHPRIRGERVLACLAGRPVVRFIPAYAGNALPISY